MNQFKLALTTFLIVMSLSFFLSQASAGVVFEVETTYHSGSSSVGSESAREIPMDKLLWLTEMAMDQVESCASDQSAVEGNLEIECAMRKLERAIGILKKDTLGRLNKEPTGPEREVLKKAKGNVLAAQRNLRATDTDKSENKSD